MKEYTLRKIERVLPNRFFVTWIMRNGTTQDEEISEARYRAFGEKGYWQGKDSLRPANAVGMNAFERYTYATPDAPQSTFMDMEPGDVCEFPEFVKIKTDTKYVYVTADKVSGTDSAITIEKTALPENITVENGKLTIL